MSRKLEHGEGKTRLYGCWTSMKTRCNNPNYKGYESYGGRGIDVCDEWKSNYLSFKKWAIENGYSDELTLDRIDNDKGYSPSNCRWITRKEQQRNKRNNCLVTFCGVTQPLSAWSEATGIDHGTLWNRLFILKWSDERVLTTPKRKCKRKEKNRDIVRD